MNWTARARLQVLRRLREQLVDAKPKAWHDDIEYPGLPSLRVGRAILAHQPSVPAGAFHVDVGAGGDVGRRPRADLEIERRRARIVDQVMAVAGALRKGGAIAGAQQRLAAVLDQDQLAFE